MKFISNIFFLTGLYFMIRNLIIDLSTNGNFVLYFESLIFGVLSYAMFVGIKKYKNQKQD